MTINQNRKAQLSLIILIGIVLMIAVAFVLYTTTRPKEVIFETPLITREMTGRLLTCIDQVAVPGTYLLAYRGGMISDREPALRAEEETIAYHIYDGSRTAPSRHEMESDLASHIAVATLICLGQEATEHPPMDVNTTINEDQIIVKVHYPLAITSGDTTAILDDQTRSYPLRLGHLLDVEDKLLGLIQNDSLPLDALSKLDAQADVLPYDNRTFIYTLAEPSSSSAEHYSSGNPLRLNFAVRDRRNTAPSLAFIPDFTLSPGSTLRYGLEASDQDGDPLKFFVKEGNARIEGNNNLVYTATGRGKATLQVCVSDTQGAQDCGMMVVTQNA